MEYHSVLKRNELASHEKIWRNLKCILPSERSQSEKATFCDSNSMTFWKTENYKDNKKIRGYQGFGGRERRMIRRTKDF